MAITLNPVTDDLWQPTASVSGTVGDPSYSVRVNGIQASSYDINWSADSVPVSEGGTAIFLVEAYAPGETRSSSATRPDLDKDATIVHLFVCLIYKLDFLMQDLPDVDN
jgi:hypothetical protein